MVGMGLADGAAWGKEYGNQQPLKTPLFKFEHSFITDHGYHIAIGAILVKNNFKFIVRSIRDIEVIGNKMIIKGLGEIVNA